MASGIPTTTGTKTSTQSTNTSYGRAAFANGPNLVLSSISRIREIAEHTYAIVMVTPPKIRRSLLTVVILHVFWRSCEGHDHSY